MFACCISLLQLSHLGQTKLFAVLFENVFGCDNGRRAHTSIVSMVINT